MPSKLGEARNLKEKAEQEAAKKSDKVTKKSKKSLLLQDEGKF